MATVHKWENTFMDSLHLIVSLLVSDPSLYCWKNSGEKRKQEYAEWEEFTALSANFQNREGERDGISTTS